MLNRKTWFSLVILAGVVTVGLVPWLWATGTAFSGQHQGAMQNCPAPGKWAISVWRGEDATDADQALDTCGEGAVAAAYHLDPQTQAWLRWFADQPQVSNLQTLQDSQGIIALGAANTPQATPTPSAAGDAEWTLVVDGLVQDPLTLTFDDLIALPESTVYAELYCVGAPQRLLAEGNWKGVRLGLILQEAGVLPEAVKVAFYADDGFTTDLTVSTAMREDIVLAYERDGEPLEEKVRLVVPGKWGYKWIRDVTHIELVDYDFKGLWESVGYSDEADIASGPG